LQKGKLSRAVRRCRLEARCLMKTVLITGGSSGIGAAIAVERASRGWGVVIGYASGRERAQTLADSIRSRGGQAWPLEIRLEDLPSISQAVEAMRPFTTDLQAAVFCASPAPELGPFLKVTPQSFYQQFNVNAIGYHHLIALIWKTYFRPNKTGHIVAVLSAAAESPVRPQMISYIVGKRSLQAILECALAELGVSGLRATAVSPTYTETPMLSGFHPHILEAARAKQPEGRFLSADHVSNIIGDCLDNPPETSELKTLSVGL
jgi:3-oxoacyl-[acyl-carrier protein] reductase